jgi:hypothetical protein
MGDSFCVSPDGGIKLSRENFHTFRGVGLKQRSTSVIVNIGLLIERTL